MRSTTAVLGRAAHQVVESLESRTLLANNIELLGQNGVWTTTANSDIVVETGVHVRAKQSFIDAYPASQWDYNWSFEPQAAGAESFEINGFSAANLYTATGNYTVELTLTPTGNNSSNVSPESLDIDVVNPTGGWTDVNVSSSSALTTAINNLNNGNLENRRILLQRNTTYTLGGSFSSISDVRNIVIRAADGTGSLPEIKVPAANFSESNYVFDIQSDASTGSGDISRNITIRDIKVTTDSNSQTSKHDSPQFVRPTGSNIVVANIQYTNLDTFIRSEGSPNYLDGLLVLNNTQLAGSSTNDYAIFVKRASKNSSGQPLVPSGGVASVVSSVTIIGNTFRDSYYEHNIRTLADYVNASNNTLINSFNLNILAGSTPNKKSFNTLRANHGKNIWWDSNQVYSGQVQLILAPPSDGGFDAFDRIENVVIRRNHFHAEAQQDGTAGMAMFGNPLLQIKPGPKQVVIDNNILEAPGRYAFEIHSAGSIVYSGTPNNGTVQLATEDVAIRHNTVLDINPRVGQSGNTTISAYTTDPVEIADVNYSAGVFLRVLSTPGSPFLSLQNNLFVAPYLTTASSTRGGVVIDSSSFSSVFSSVRGNIWPSIANMHRTGSGRVSNSSWLATYGGEPGFVTVLKDDFDDVVKWIPGDSVASTLNVVSQASGLRGDIYGNLRPTPASTNPHTAGAVQIGDNTGGTPTGAISGLYFNDANGNGALDGPEGSWGSGKTFFIDTNANGTLDTGELTADTVTNGTYTFSGLEPGTYRVTRTFPTSGFHWSLPEVGYRLVSVGNTAVTGQDFGSTTTVEVRGTYFSDANGNGTQDAGESGLAGKAIYIDQNGNDSFDTGEPSATTDSAGEYRIIGLASGTALTVRQNSPLTGYTLISPSGGELSLANSSPGVILLGNNFAVQPDTSPTTGTITGTYYNDSNGNGIMDGSESGSGAINRRIYADLDNNGSRGAGEPFDDTDGNGVYVLTDVSVGQQVVVRRDGLPAGFRLSQLSAGYQLANVVAGQTTSNIDLGATSTTEIQGHYFIDLDGDGVFDKPDETANTSGVVFVDLDSDGVKDSNETVTGTAGSDGLWRIYGLVANATYRVAPVVPAGYAISAGSVAFYTEAIGSNQAKFVADRDFGIVQDTGSISGLFYGDGNGNGQQDSGESGQGGKTIYVDLDNDGVLDTEENAFSAITSSSGDPNVLGTWTISGLPAGAYVVRRNGTPAGYRISDPAAGYLIVDVAAGEAVAGIKLASSTYSEIQGYVFIDANGNGAFDVGEDPGNGTEVYVDTDNDGVKDVGETTVATTDSIGLYRLTGLAGSASNYVIRPVVPSGYALGDAAMYTVAIPVGSPGFYGDRSFGLQIASTGSISGTYYSDSNGNGIMDGSESGSGAINRRIYADLDNNGSRGAGEPFDDTDGNGVYGIDGLSAGTYVLRREGLPSGYRISEPVAGYQAVTLIGGQAVTGVDFGSTSSSELRGTVFIDADSDGNFDSSESAYESAVAYIDANSNGSKDVGEQTATTDASGLFRFSGLAANTYVVRLDLPVGHQIAGTPSSYSVSISSGTPVLVSQRNFGIIQTGSSLPDAPGGVATLVTAVSGSYATAQVSWSDVSGENGYTIQRRNSAVGSFSTVGTVGQNVTSFSDTAAPLGLDVSYRVIATSASGNSPTSISVYTPIPSSGKSLVVNGTSGNDILLMSYDSGNSRYVFGSARYSTSAVTSVTINAGSGDDEVDVDSSVTLAVYINGDDGVDSIEGGSGADTINGGAGNDTIYGNDGADNIYGGADNDSLFGGAGNDSFFGGAGNDTMVGGTGNDTLRGETGTDTVSYGDKSSPVNVSWDGSDGVSGEADLIIKRAANSSTAGNEIIEGGSGADIINAANAVETGASSSYGITIRGGGGNDTITGSAYRDSLLGGDGNDSIQGGSERDTLKGEAGNDYLNGNSGSDYFYGGSGTDSMYGGSSGDDKFSAEDGVVDLIDGGDGNDTFIQLSDDNYDVDRTSEGDPVNDNVTSVS